MDKYEAITAEFFKKRFPDKDIRFEVKCGYFDEWVKRFESGRVKRYCDQDSLAIVIEMGL